MNAYGGRAFVDVRGLFQARGLNLERFDNLMMEKKAVALPWEDVITNAVNAAAPLVRSLPAEDRARIELVITATESGIDFAKSTSTYIHHHLELPRNCRVFEVKQACYGGMAALQMALGFVASGASPGAKALVIASDEARAGARNTYYEPSQGTGAVAMLVSASPQVLAMDLGANGYASFEVMDAYRPQPALEAGDPDLSLLSYLECLQNSFTAYSERVEDADFQRSFDYLAFHTPFAGMVKGAHRKMMRSFGGSGLSQLTIDEDFKRRLGPALPYCQAVGNFYSGTVFLALAGLFDQAPLSEFQRVGIFSYGSGCSSEFCSGVFTPQARRVQARFGIGAALAARHALSMNEYEAILDCAGQMGFGTRDLEVPIAGFGRIYERCFAGQGLLRLERVKNFHREYAWT